MGFESDLPCGADYTILVFAQDVKKWNGVPVPFNFLGPVESTSFEDGRLIKMV